MKCEYCGGEGIVKLKDGSIINSLVAVKPYSKHIDFRAKNHFHWRCWKCKHKIIGKNVNNKTITI